MGLISNQKLTFKLKKFENLMVSILLIRAGQDIALRPLASFLQPVWNSLNRLPLHRWLQSDYDDQYRNRMHALGNIVVPAGGKLGLNLLQRMSSQHDMAKV